MFVENQTRPHLVHQICNWAFRIFGVFFILVLFVLIVFSVQASRREVKTSAQVAVKSGRFIDAGDVEIFIQEVGPKLGEPVLLVHGTGAWSEIWRETMSNLAENGFRAIAIDLPPFGYSGKPYGPDSYSRKNQAQRIIAVLNALHIEKAVLVGHSVGGRPTIEVALRVPERVKKLILIDPALGFTLDKPNFEQNKPTLMTRIFFKLRPLRNAILATYGTNPFFTEKLFKSFVSNTAAVTKERVKMLQRPLVVKNTTNAYGDWLQYLMVERDTSLASNFSNFSKLQMPVGILWGGTDSVTPLWQGDALQKLIPNSKLAVIDAAGHIPYIESVTQFNILLLQYLHTLK